MTTGSPQELSGHFVFTTDHPFEPCLDIGLTKDSVKNRSQPAWTLPDEDGVNETSVSFLHEVHVDIVAHTIDYANDGADCKRLPAICFAIWLL